MNAPIARLFALVVVLFALLVGFTSRWTVFEADDLRAHTLNKRDVLQEQRIRRGRIRASDRTLLARSVAADAGTFRRQYTPDARLFAHAVGYSFPNPGRTGLERTYNDDLSGQRNELKSVVDELRGERREGDDLITTFDPRAQRVALAGLAGRRGSVVALDPRTGAVRVLASVPSFDPNAARSARTFSALNRAEGSPLLQRATQGAYPPGSTFKVLTAVAALDSGKFTPASQVDGRNAKLISGAPLNNFGNASFGPVDLTTALTKSINTVWAEVAERVGKPTMRRYMERFGFDRPVAIDLPRAQRRTSGVYPRGDIVPPTSRLVDIGRVGIGQGALLVSPLQMAMVGAAVANGGRLMRPHIGDRVVDRDGRVVRRIEPEELSRVMSAATAARVREMMKNVVREGTGTAAALEGIDVAGKTGTAELNVAQRLNQLWFLGFEPADRPRIVVVATIERGTAQTGGEVAAPIAKAVMEALLR